MEDTRVLPSGKVYRQMFDAQVIVHDKCVFYLLLMLPLFYCRSSSGLKTAVACCAEEALGACVILSVCAQVQLSLALYDSRRKRAADERDCGDAADSASQQLNETFNITRRYESAAAAAHDICFIQFIHFDFNVTI